MRIRSTLAACLAVAAAWALEVHPASDTPEPIRVAVTGPYTGPSSPMGLSMLAGVQIAVDEINLAGGIMGKKIDLVVKDDKADPEEGSRVVREAILGARVVAGLGFANTGVALAAQRHYQAARIPVITNVAAGTAITRQFAAPQYKENYVFRVAAHDAIQSAKIVRDAVEKHGFRRLAVFHDSTPYGEQGRQQLEAELGKRGLKPVAVERFGLGTVDFSGALQRAREARAEGILIYGIGPEMAAIANQRAKMNWSVPMIGSWTLSLPNFIQLAGRNAEGVRMPQTFIEEANNSRRTGFIVAYHNANGTKRIPSAVSAAQGYDSMYLLIAAMIQANSLEGPRLREALENLGNPMYGVITTYRRPFTPDDHEALTENMVVMGEVRRGRVVYAYPEEERRSLIVSRKM